MRTNEHLLIPIIQYALKNQDLFGPQLNKAGVGSWGDLYGIGPRRLRDLSLNLYTHVASLVRQNVLSQELSLVSPDQELSLSVVLDDIHPGCTFVSNSSVSW